MKKISKFLLIIGFISIALIVVITSCPDPAAGPKESVKAIAITTEPADVSALDNDATVTVELATATEGATIYYTLDGSTPTASSTKYTAAFTVEADGEEGETVTLKAIGIKAEFSNSAVADKAIVFKPSGAYTTALDAVNSKNTKAEMKSTIELHATILGLDIGINSDYQKLEGHEASYPGHQNRKESAANYLIDKREAILEGEYTSAAQIATAFDEGVAYELGKLDFHAVIKNATAGEDSLTLAFTTVRDVYATMADNLGIDLDDPGQYVGNKDLFDLIEVLDTYIGLTPLQQEAIDEDLLNAVTGNDRLSRDEVFGTLALLLQ